MCKNYGITKKNFHIMPLNQTRHPRLNEIKKCLLRPYKTASGFPIDFSIGKKRRQRSMQIWSALGTSDGTGGAASADNRTGGLPLEVGVRTQTKEKGGYTR